VGKIIGRDITIKLTKYYGLSWSYKLKI